MDRLSDSWPDAQAKSVYVLIPVHNRCAVTLTCLQRLRQLGIMDRYQVVIIDDGSTDGTAAAVAQTYPDVIVLTGDGHLWWTGAMALGMAYARDRAAHFVIWLNDDCWPAPHSLERLVAFAAQHPGTIVAAAPYLPQQSTPLMVGFRGRQRLTAQPGEVVEIEGSSGYCVVIPIPVIQQIGLPDARRFPHYGGDGMYLLRATRAGFRACILGDARVDLPETRDTINRLPDARQKFPTWSRLFFWQKSPYHLPTQFFYHCEKYGTLQGSIWFIAKAIGWMFQFVWLRP